MTAAGRQLESLALVVHGALATLHLLAVAYHLPRKQRVDATLHLAAASYDLIAARRHLRRVSRDWRAA